VAGANNALNNDIFKIVSVISPRIAELAVCGTYPESLTILMQETLPQEATITISPYRVEGVPDAALVSPYFEPIVISAEYIADDEVELTLNDDITQNREYVFHAYGVEDLNENTINDNASFTTEGLDIPVSRINGRFDYANLLPYANQRPEEDGTKDLERFIKCIDEVLQLILHSVDTFPYIMDPNLISDNNLDALLAHLGAPFSFVPSLEEVDKRRLAAILVDSYKIKGTELGIEAMISYVLGITVNIQPFYDIENLWVLGESMLGVDTILGPGSEFLKYSFEVITDTSLTEAQRRYITEIVEWMKPCHTHFVRLREPGIAIELNDNIIAFDSVVVELPMEANISDSISTVDEIALSGDVLDMVLPLDTITEMVDEVVLGGVLHKVFSNSISVTDQISVIVIET
jgi:phage tail-like protein